MVGQKILNYEIVKFIGEGGMGSIYLGVNKIGSKVAIKSLHPLLVRNADIKKRFMNEAITLQKLRHPNVVSLINYDEDENGAYLFMEYVEGKALDDYIKNVSGAIAEPKTIELFAQILDGVGYAHKQQIIHRDIKPSNFILTDSGEVKTLDFGIAKALADSNYELTRTGIQVGSPFYMSPEQVKGIHLDTRTDIYSLGVTLFQMLTGHCPYDNTTNQWELNNKIVNEPLPDPRQFHPDVSEKMRSIIIKATEKDPAKRFQNCEEFKVALLHGLPNVSDGARTVIGTPAVDENWGQKTVLNTNQPVTHNTNTPTDLGKTQISTSNTAEKSGSKTGEKINPTPTPTPPNNDKKDKPKSRRSLMIIIGLAVVLLGTTIVLYTNTVRKEKQKNHDNAVTKADDFLKKSQYDSALAQYEKALTYKSVDEIEDKVEALKTFNLALDSMYNGQFTSAFNNFKKTNELSPLADADYYLGEFTYNGMGTTRNDSTAFAYTTSSYNKGFKMAAWRLGWAYQNGKGAAVNDSTAKKYYNESIPAIKELANNGDPEAQSNLAWLYADGKTLKLNEDSVIYWFTKSAEQGNVMAQKQLGDVYAGGINGKKKDATKAQEWYQKAADKGYVEAQVSLAGMYYNGIGVTKDYAKAKTMYEKAAQAGNANAMNQIGMIYYQGNGVDVDKTKALEWFEKAVKTDSTNTTATINTAYLYYMGEGTKAPDYATSAKYYERVVASDSTNLDACQKLATMYAKGGNGLTADPAKALTYRKKAALAGSLADSYELGNMYYYGRGGVGVNYAESKKWFLLAQRQGSADAYRMLGKIEEKGY